MESLKIIERYVDVLLNSDIHLLVISGPPGIGKSSNVLRHITEMGLVEGMHFMYETGYMTPLAMFKSLAKSRLLENPKLLIYDDIDSILKNKVSVGILKGALADVRGTRTVSYQSTKSTDKDQTFEFAGKVILILNDVKNSSFIEPLLDRGIYYNIQLRKDELEHHIENNLVSMFPTMDNDAKRMVWDRIKIFTGLEHFSLRTIRRAFEMYKNNKDDWFLLFKKSLRTKE